MMDVARLLAQRMLVMQDGCVVEQGLTDRVLDDPQHPYTQLLLDSMLTVAPGKGIPELRLDTAAREAMRDNPVHIVTN